jgi:dihydroorotase
MTDLFIEDIHLPDGAPAHVLVQHGRIEAISRALEPPPHVPRLLGRGRLLLPGAIDMHVHFRTPGAEHKETLLTGSRAAAKGGVTTVADMPNTNPATTTLETLEQKVRLADGALTNVFFNFGVEPAHINEILRVARHPRVKAIKVYLGPSTGVGGLAPEVAERAFRLAADMDLPVMVHAEDIALIQREAARHPHDARHHHLLRPLEAELLAVDQALGMAKRHGTRLYLCHVTSAQVLERVERSGLGERVFVEVCPHHLLLSTDDIEPPRENRYKVNPPLRPEAEREALFAELPRRIDGLASDHAPHTLAEKELRYDQAPSGIPGVEHLLPLAIDWWRHGVIDTHRLIGLTSANAARFFRLNKGELHNGADADLVLVDPEQELTLGHGGDRVLSKCDWSPYLGRTLRGRVEVTIVAGRIVYDWEHEQIPPPPLEAP